MPAAPAASARSALDRPGMSRSGSQGDWSPSATGRSRVFGLRTDDAIRARLFERVCNPAAHPADGKRRCEERHLEAESVEQQRRVELDVGLEPAARLVLLEQTK